MMYKSPHSLTAMNRLLWKKKKKRTTREREKKKDWTYQCLCWTGCRCLRLSLAFVFKRQSTVKTKRNGHGVSFVFFFSFLFLTFCICNKGAWVMKPQIVKRRWFYSEWRTNGWSYEGNRSGGGVRWQLLKLPAEWTQNTNELARVASEFCHKTKVCPL